MSAPGFVLTCPLARTVCPTTTVQRRTRPLLRLTSQSYKNIRDSIPEKRRLKFAAQDGYGPLCKFLVVPVTIVNDERTNEIRVVEDSSW